MQTRHQFLTSLVPLTKLPEGIEDECSVCAEEFVGPVELPCKHLFCKGCISDWLSRRNRVSCPICRATLITSNDADRGPLGANRLQVVAQALEYSRLMTDDGFDVYDEEIFTTRSAVQRATAAATRYLADEVHPPTTDTLLFHIETLRPHLIAMGNLLARGYARAMGRPYSGYQRRDWKLIVSQLYTLLESVNGQVLPANCTADVIPRFRAKIRESLREDGIDTESGHFFQHDDRMESPSGDLDVLLTYIVDRCAKAHKEREKQRTALKQAQKEALGAETTKIGYAIRWMGQRLFQGI